MINERVSVAIPAKRDELVKVLRALEVVGCAQEVSVYSREEFVTEDGDHVFSDDLKLTRLSRGEFFLWARVDGKEMRIKPRGAYMIVRAR